MWSNIKEPITIPYFDHDKSLVKTIKNSSSRRKMSPLYFTWRKIRNIVLYQLSYMCPINSLRVKMHRLRGVNIGENVYIGMHCVIDNAYPEYVYIGDNASIAGGVTLLAHSNPYGHFKTVTKSQVSPIVIEDGAWIGINAIILLGVVVGERAIISAGTVVDRDVKPMSIASGNPMRNKIDISNVL